MTHLVLFRNRTMLFRNRTVLLRNRSVLFRNRTFYLKSAIFIINSFFFSFFLNNNYFNKLSHVHYHLSSYLSLWGGSGDILFHPKVFACFLGTGTCFLGTGPCFLGTWPRYFGIGHNIFFHFLVRFQKSKFRFIALKWSKMDKNG